MKESKKQIEWSEVKAKLLNGFKVAVFVIIMSIGLWAVFMGLWKVLGFPCNNIARILMFLQSVVTEYIFIKWAIK
jgi:hypothetical protein